MNANNNAGTTGARTDQRSAYNSNVNNANGSGNCGTNKYDSPPQQTYPYKKSTAKTIIGIALILYGVYHIVDKFIPWLFDWIDSGIVFSAAAIVIGFVILVKR